MIPPKFSIIGFTTTVMLAAAAAAAVLQERGARCNPDQVILGGKFVHQDAPVKLFQNEALLKHNELRAKHGSPPLHWNSTLEAFASARDQTCVFEHTPPPRTYGENIAWGYSSKDGAVQGWYDEVANYDYNNPVFGYNTGHFTQVVWKASTELGCGGVECPPYGLMITCEYYPPGNVEGQFADNVLRPA